MKSIGLFKALKLCKDYQKMDLAARDTLRSKRLLELLTYTRAHSPYYAKLYSCLPENPEMSTLPPVTKPQLMAHWDEWVTDRTVTLDDVNQFMSSRDNLGKKLNGTYQGWDNCKLTDRMRLHIYERTNGHLQQNSGNKL